MRKIIILFLLMPVIAFAQHRTGKVAEAITEAKAEHGAFQSFEIHNPITKSATADYSKSVNDGVVFTLDQTRLQNLLAENPKQMSLNVPFTNGQTVSLDLIQMEVFAPGFKAVTDTGQDITNEVDFGKHYRGVISGDEHSLVAISIYESQISGFISNHDGNHTLGKIRTSDTDHIIYKDTDLDISEPNLSCATEDDGVGYTVEQLTPSQTEMDPGDEVDIYIEAGRSVYNTFGQNLPNTVAFLTALFTQSYVLYANDGILARTSNMLIWVNPDPYTGTNSSAQLSNFATQTDFLNGDLGHLVMMQNYGGVAAGFSGICPGNSDNSLCYSGLVGTSVPDVPIYSFNVFLISHEMGHLLGSRHTHACVWNGNNTAIDGCAGFTEGSCALPGNPSEGGTIMSYCANTSVGINFNLGFGPQPLAVILNNIEEVGNCLDEEDTTEPPVAVCKTHVVTMDASGSVTIDVSDVEGGSYDNGTIVSTTIDMDTFTCDNIGFNNVTLTVTDNDGLTSTCIAYVEVIDGTDITITCPDDQVVGVPAGGSYTLEDFQDQLEVASEICANAPFDATFQSPSPGTELEIGVHVITINVLLTDGSVDSCTFEVTVEESLGLEDNVLSSLVLHPNPTVETLYLSNPENLELESMSIYDMTGRLIKSVDLNQMGVERSIDVSQLSQSNYFAIIEGAQGKVVKQLIIR
ncbi:zinc-dependent metalloprotease [Aureisphaera galaxeae]|uniref:zinc-dependent metalloprotease n=1 Tax=Aureisphaera galaxeae TaxID=1538023 RepID=UPI00234FCF01|nr:zinc-dependent metalloprotease [Aureisphaera galaxeae]MDC8004263.1 zinc-dependent metalloprotease [Aureisphaera galaxeae]